MQLLAHDVLSGESTSNQIKNTQNYAQLLSQELNFPQSLIDTFKNAVILVNTFRHLLHSEMINKKGRLSAKDWEILSDFPYRIEQITNLFDYFSGERTILLHHGERYDGKGYPEGLKGDEIPVGARIFSLVSAMAAMNADRPYRKRLTDKQILDELCNNAGKQFDPFLVIKLIDIIEEKGILALDEQSLANAREHIQKNFAVIDICHNQISTPSTARSTLSHHYRQ